MATFTFYPGNLHPSKFVPVDGVGVTYGLYSGTYDGENFYTEDEVRGPIRFKLSHTYPGKGNLQCQVDSTGRVLVETVKSATGETTLRKIIPQ